MNIEDLFRDICALPAGAKLVKIIQNGVPVFGYKISTKSRSNGVKIDFGPVSVLIPDQVGARLGQDLIELLVEKRLRGSNTVQKPG